MYRLMVVDDEPLVIKAITHIIKNNFKELVISATTGNGLEAIKYARDEKPDIIFMDIKLNGLNGLESIKEIIRFLPQSIIIIISAYDDFSFAQRAIKLGVMDYLLKPVNKADIINILSRAINSLDNLRMEIQEKMQLKEKLMGDSVYGFQPPWELERNLLKAIENGNIDQVRMELKLLYNYLEDGLSLLEIKNYFQELIGVIFRVIYEYIPIEKRKDIQLSTFQRKLSAILAKEQLFECLKDNLLSLMKIVSPSIRMETSPLIKKACKYIEENYSKDISLEDIADYIAISPNYLCKLFKENYEITIIDYLTRVRINNSINLLKNTDLSIKEIAHHTGYHDSNYFSKVFKKVTGKTPTDFRNQG